MKIKRLPYYISKFDNLEAAEHVTILLEEQNIRYIPIHDGIRMIHRALITVCSFRTAVTIMLRFMNHEIRRGRLTQEQFDEFVHEFRYLCVGCIYDQPNQLAHMEPGGCLYNEENEFY